MIKNIWRKLSKPIILLSSFSLLSLNQIALSQNAPGTKIRYKFTQLGQNQCLNRGFSILNQAESTRGVQIDSYVVSAYAGTTTVTIICITSKGTVVFTAAGSDTQNLNEWVNWLYRKF